MAKFLVKVFHVSEAKTAGRTWQPATQPAAPVHSEVFDALSRDVVLLQLQKKFPNYDEKHGYTLDITRLYA